MLWIRSKARWSWLAEERGRRPDEVILAWLWG